MPSPNLLWNTCMPERRPCEGAAFCGGLLRRHLRAGEGVLAAAVAVAAPAISTVAAARARVAAAIAERRRREALVLRREPLERAFGQFVEETALDVVAGLAVQHARLRMAQAAAAAAVHLSQPRLAPPLPGPRRRNPGAAPRATEPERPGPRSSCDARRMCGGRSIASCHSSLKPRQGEWCRCSVEHSPNAAGNGHPRATGFMRVQQRTPV